MRVLLRAVALALGCAASPALAQPLVLDVAPATEPPPPAVTETAPPVPLQAPASAAETAPAGGAAVPPRFTFNTVDGGVLRLDSASGQVAFCGARTAGWVCQAVPEDRAALETEIARLQDEVGKLKSDLAALREPPPRPPGELTPPKTGEPTIKMPSSEDVERARAIVENAWRRLVEMIDALRKDMMRKS